MSFYGNITNTAKTTFSFDKIYNTRKDMDSAADTDGIFLGRYVLIDYGEEPIKAYYNPADQSFYNTVNYTPNSKITKPKNGKIYQDLSNSYTITGSKHGFYRYEEGKGFVIVTESTSYAAYFVDDVKLYGRGYDSTAWVKRYDEMNNRYKYVMVAELNAVIPSFHIIVDEPNSTPITPYFDRETTNVDYYLHMQGDFGTRIKPLPDASLVDEGVLKSDTNIDLLTVEQKTDPNGYPYYEKIVTKDIPADIYFNKAGFEYDKRTESTGTAIYRVVDDNGQIVYDETGNELTREIDYSKNAIGYNLSQSGRLYNAKVDLGVAQNGQKYEDIYDWFVRLPGIGNSICHMWDKVYGYQETGEQLRYINDAQHRKDASSESDYLVNYDRTTLLGLMNTYRDILGYYYIAKADVEGKDNITNINEKYTTTKTYFKNGVEKKVEVSYPLLNCLIYDDSTPEIQYLYYRFNPQYTKFNGMPNPEETYYYEENGIYYIANNVIDSKSDANENPIVPQYYTRTNRWTLAPLVRDTEDSIYGLINTIHKLLGTSASEHPDPNSVLGCINMMKSIIRNINVNLQPGRLLHTNNDGIIETTTTYFPAADWDQDELLDGSGNWVSRFASVKIRKNEENWNRKIPKVVKFENTEELGEAGPVQLMDLYAELVSDNQRTKITDEDTQITSLAYKKEHDPNTLIMAAGNNWIKLVPDATDDSIEFTHSLSPIVNNLSITPLDNPIGKTAYNGPEGTNNSSINEDNFIAKEDGTKIVIRPSNINNTLIFNENDEDRNDNCLTIPTITVDNAGHIVEASTKNYNIPHNFKKIKTTTVEDTDETPSEDKAGISIAETINDILNIAPQNRWIDIATVETNAEDGSQEDQITFGHRLVPYEIDENNNIIIPSFKEIPLNGDGKIDKVPTVYRFGLPQDKTTTDLDEDNINEKANTFNVPYFAVDKAGHIVAAETHTVEVPHVYNKLSVGQPVIDDSIEKDTAGYTTDELGKESTGIQAETLHGELKFQPKNKWIRIAAENNDEEDIDNINFAHEIHHIDITPIDSEDLDTINSDNQEKIQKDQFITESLNWDEAGHIISKTTKTWTLPDSFRNIHVVGETNKVDEVETNDTTLEADNTFDTFDLTPANKWIRMSSDAANDIIKIGHTHSPVSADNRTFKASGSNAVNGAVQADNEFKIPSFIIDEAGHVVEQNSVSLYVPHTFKKININASSTSSGDIAPNTELISLNATGITDTLTFNTGNKWIKSSVDNVNKIITFSHNHSGVKVSAEDGLGTYGSVEDQMPLFGSKFSVPGYKVDAAGHIVTSDTYLIKMPELSYEESGGTENANSSVLTSITLISEEGKLTGTKTDIGNLCLVNYETQAEATDPNAILVNDTLHTIITKLEKSIALEKETRESSINDLRLFSTITVYNDSETETAGTIQASSYEDDLTLQSGRGIILDAFPDTETGNNIVSIKHENHIPRENNLYSITVNDRGHVEDAIPVTQDDLITNYNVATENNVEAKIQAMFDDIVANYGLVLNAPVITDTNTTQTENGIELKIQIQVTENDIYKSIWLNADDNTNLTEEVEMIEGITTYEALIAGNYKCIITRTHNNQTSTTTSETFIITEADLPTINENPEGGDPIDPGTEEETPTEPESGV